MARQIAVFQGDFGLGEDKEDKKKKEEEEEGRRVAQ
jgi:hypothetical protein